MHFNCRFNKVCPIALTNHQRDPTLIKAWSLLGSSVVRRQQIWEMASGSVLGKKDMHAGSHKNLPTQHLHCPTRRPHTQQRRHPQSFDGWWMSPGPEILEARDGRWQVHPVGDEHELQPSRPLPGGTGIRCLRRPHWHTEPPAWQPSLPMLPCARQPSLPMLPRAWQPSLPMLPCARPPELLLLMALPGCGPMPASSPSIPGGLAPAAGCTPAAAALASTPGAPPARAPGAWSSRMACGCG